MLVRGLLFVAFWGTLGTLALALSAVRWSLPATHMWIAGAISLLFVLLSFSGAGSLRRDSPTRGFRLLAGAAGILVVGIAWFHDPEVALDRHRHRAVSTDIRCDGVSRERLNQTTEHGRRFIEATCAQAEIARIRWEIVSQRDARRGLTLLLSALAACWIGLALTPSSVLRHALREAP